MTKKIGVGNQSVAPGVVAYRNSKHARQIFAAGLLLKGLLYSRARI